MNRISKIALRFAGAACALLAGVLLPAAASADPCKISSFELPVTMKDSRAVATVGINGAQVPLMVDSGAFFSFLTPAAAQQLKLDVGMLPVGLRVNGWTGEVDAGLATVKHLQLLGGDLPDMEFIVGGNEMGAGTMGILGRNIVHASDVEYDLAHGVIRLMFPSGDCSGKVMAYWADGAPIAELALSREDRRTKFPEVIGVVALNGQKMRVLFDTGSMSFVSLGAAKRLGLTEANMKPAGKSYGAGRGYARSWTATFDTFEIGGEKISNLRASVVDFPNMSEKDMVLGIDFFLSHRIYISKRQHMMYLTYNGGPVFALSDTDRTPPGAQAASAPALDSADAYARRGAAQAARRDYVSALSDLDRAVAMSPEVAEYLVRRAQIHEMLHQGEAAQTDYDAALKLDPNQPDALLHRAVRRIAKHDQDGALQDLQTLDHALPAQANQRLQLANLYVRLDQRERAIPQWDQWIASHEQDISEPQARSDRCWTRVLLGIELDKALDDCDRAVDAEPDNPHFRDSRAWLHVRRNELSKALSDFDRAIKTQDKLAWARYGRGLVHLRQGDAAAAQADLAVAREQLPKIDEQARRYGLEATN